MVTGSRGRDLKIFEQANVTLSLGSKCKDSVKAESDIDLCDDDLTRIIEPVKYGRNIYRCARKYLSYVITSNLTLFMVSIVSTIFMYQPPLNVMQILWIELVQDMIAV
jgi:P-type Ca2+ transporter type 2C